VRVARLHGPGDLRLTEEPTPPVPGGWTLIRVTAVGLCGSDLHWFAEGGIGDARLEAPLVVGHEFAGVIDSGPRKGEAVAVDPAIPCGTCATCRSGRRHLCPTVAFAGHGSNDGALREYLAWPMELVHPLPAPLTGVDGAMLEPLGVAVHAIDLGHVRLGSAVAVVGCGPIGLLLLQAVRAAGATTVIAVEPLRHRREAAQRLGADVVLTPDEARATAGAGIGGPGVDVAFEIAGTDRAVETAMDMVRPGGRIVLAGIPDTDMTSFPAALARRKGLTIAMSRRMSEVYPRATSLVVEGLVDVASLVSARYPLEQVAEAFELAVARSGLKTVVEMP
jgi:L-iditol 2-dehydrogenase